LSRTTASYEPSALGAAIWKLPATKEFLVVRNSTHTSWVLESIIWNSR